MKLYVPTSQLTGGQHIPIRQGDAEPVVNTWLAIVNHDDVVAYLTKQVRFRDSTDVATKGTGGNLRVARDREAADVDLQRMVNEVDVAKEVVVLTTSYQTEIGVCAIVDDEAASRDPVAGARNNVG